MEREQRVLRALVAADLARILGNLDRVLDFYRMWRSTRFA